MRNASHRFLYNIVNSSAMNGISQTSRVVSITPAWMNWLHAADVVIALVCVAGPVLGIAALVGREKLNWKKSTSQTSFVIGLAGFVFTVSYAVLTYVAFLAAQSF